MPTILANEVKVLISERGAEWLPEIDFHNNLLGEVDEMVFYAACLTELRQKYEPLDQQDLAWAEELYTFVIQEIDVLKNKNHWPDRVPALELLI